MNVGFRFLLLSSVALFMGACTNVIPEVTSLSAPLPPVRITSPASGTHKNSTNLVISGVCETGADVQLSGDAAILLGDPDLDGDVECAPGGTFGATIDLTAGDGIKTVTVAQTNSETNEVNSSEASWTLDTVSPLVNITTTAGTHYPQINSLTLDGTCEMGLPVHVVGDIAAPVTGTCNAPGVFSIPVVFTSGEGAKSISAEQTDLATNYSSAMVSVNFDEEDPMINFVTTTSNPSEGTGIVNHQVPVSLTSSRTTEMVVYYSVLGSSTATSDDFSPLSGSLTFPAGSTVQNILVPILPDNISEGSETVEIQITGFAIQNIVFGPGAYIGSQDTHTVVISDNDGIPVLSFASLTQSSGEGDGAQSIVVNMSNPSSSTVNVNFTASGGTALGSNTDYYLADGILTFLPGEVWKTIPVTIIDDVIYEPNETFQVTLFSPTNAVMGAGLGVLTYTILENDPIPVIEFSVASTSLLEGDTGTFAHFVQVSLSHPSSQDVTVNFARDSVSPGTAQAVDFALGAGPLTIPAGSFGNNITVDIIGDVSDEVDETINLRLSSPVGAILGTQVTHEITIIDDDASPFTWTGAAANSLWSDPGNWSSKPGFGDTAVFDSTCGANCNVVIDEDINIGSIRIESSFNGSMNNLNIVSLTGDFIVNSQNVVIDIYNYFAARNLIQNEGDLYIHAPLDISGNYTVGANALTSYDMSSIVYFTNTTTTNVSIANNSSFMNVHILKSTGLMMGDPLEVYGNLTLDSCGHVNNDIVLITGSTQLLNASGGCSIQNLNVNAVGNIDIIGTLVIEGHYLAQNFTSLAANGATINFTGTSSALIDPGAGVQYGNLVMDKTANVPVTLINNSMFVQSLFLQSSAGGTLNGLDYFVSGSLVSNGMYAGSSPIHVIGTAAQSISAGTNGTFPLIVINKTGGPLNFISNVGLSEGLHYISGSIDFQNNTLKFVGSSDAFLNMNNGVGTINGSIEINKTGGHLTFVNRVDVLQNLTILSSANDVLWDGEVAVYGNVLKDGATLGGNATIRLTGVGNQQIGGSSPTFSSHLIVDKPSGLMTPSANITFAAGYNVHVVQGWVDQGLYNVSGLGTVDLALGTKWVKHCRVGPTSATGAGLLIDGDEVAITMQTPANVTEGNNAEFPLTISPASCGPIVLVWETVAGTAVSDVDYQSVAPGTTATIPASATSFTLSTSVLNDGVAEAAAENFAALIVATSPGVTLFGTNPMDVTIEPDASLQVQFATAASSEQETVGTANVMVSLNAISATDVYVNYSVTGGTATNGGIDFTLANGVLTIPAGNMAAPINVAINNDSDPELSETIEITLSAPMNASLGATTVYTLTIQDDDLNPFTWIGAGGDSNWTTAANWAGGVVPNNTQTAIFNELCILTANCNPVINASVTVGGIHLEFGYAGMITQSSSLVVSGDFIIEGGTFNVATTAITIQGSFIRTGGAFNPGSSTVVIDGTGSATIDLNGGAVNALFLQKNGTLNIMSAFNVNGALTLNNPGLLLMGGTIDAKAGVNVTAASGGSTLIRLSGTLPQTLNGTAGGVLPSVAFANNSNQISLVGTVEVERNLTLTSGSVFAGTSTVRFVGSANSAINAPSMNFSSVHFAKVNPGVSTLNGQINVLDTLSILNCSTCPINGTQFIKAHGNVILGNNGGGQAIVHLVGTGIQQIQQTAGTWPSNAIEVLKPSGRVVQNSLMGLSYLLINTAAPWDMAGNQLEVTTSLSLGTGAEIYKNCGTLNVSGNPIVQGSYGSGMIYDGTYGVTLNLTAPSPVTEGSTQNWVVTQTPTNCVQTSFNYATTYAPSANANDFTAVSGLGTIPANQSNMTIAVNTLQDSVYEPTEAYTMTLSGFSPGVLAGATIADTGTILDDDSMPTISINSITVMEGQTAFVVATLSGPSGENVTFNYSTSNGTALAGSDYTAASGGPLTIAAGVTSLTLPGIFTTGADAAESLEYFTVSLSSIVGAQAGSVSANVNLSDSTNGMHLGTITPMIETYNSFGVTVPYIGDLDNNGTATLYFCNRTDNPSCDPYMEGVGASLTREPGNILKGMVSGLAAPNDPGDVFALMAVATDPAGSTNSPLGSVVLFGGSTPTIVYVTSATANGVYSDGDVVNVQLVYSVPVQVTDGSAQISLNSAGIANYSGGSGTNILQFSYPVQENEFANELDLAAVAVNTSNIRSLSNVIASNNVPAFYNLSFMKDIRINERPKITGTSCFFEGYANDYYRGCSFGAAGLNNTGYMPDMPPMYEFVYPDHTCTWATTINSSGIVNNGNILIPNNALEQCTFAVRVSDGHHTSDIYRFPVRIKHPDGFSTVSQSGYHACAIVDGRLKCWGAQNASALALGDENVPPGDFANYAIPRISLNGPEITGATDVKTGGSAVGNGFTCIRLLGGSVGCWGANNYGQLGRGIATSNSGTFNFISGQTEEAISLETGGQFSCALFQTINAGDTGKVRCWGFGTTGQMGNGGTVAANTLMVAVNLSLPAVQLSVGVSHACVVTSDGAVRCWGANNNGQIGNGNSTTQTTPFMVPGFGPNNRAIKVVAGENHTCALSANNELRCWGLNSSGQLGQNNTTSLLTPSPPIVFPAPSNADPIIDLALSGTSTCALFHGVNRYLRCWGGNTTGILGNDSLSTSGRVGDVAGSMSGLQNVNLGSGIYPYSISMRKATACAVVGDAISPTGVKCWGNNSNAQIGEAASSHRGSNAIDAGMGDDVPFVKLYPKIYYSSGTVAANMVLGNGINTGFYQCAISASNHPAAEHVKVLVSTSTMAARDLYTSTIPVVRADGQVIADTWAGVYDNVFPALNPFILAYDGTNTSQTIWTGSNSSGLLNNNCQNWSTISASETATRGLSSSNTTSWQTSASENCGTSHRVYCLIP